MKFILLIHLFFCIYSIVLGNSKEQAENEEISQENAVDVEEENVNAESCWMTLDAPRYFKILDEIDDRYAEIRKAVQESLNDSALDFSMIEGLLRDKGVPQMSHKHKPPMIPSGLNLGGFCMMWVPGSVLFFHRMKLRNNTFFRLNDLTNDLSNMVVRMHLSLNDLHLKGAYERCLADRDPAVLIYAPTFGEVEFLMKDVKYKVEGRYRLIQNKLLIELISSEIIVDDILMTYKNKAIESSPMTIRKENLGNFIDRMKTDLDKWLKYYFNNYLTHAEMDKIPHLDELSKYDKEKGLALEEFADNSILAMATRIRQLNAANINLPSLTLKSVNKMEIKLHNGVLYGLDSLYRRSVATGYKQKDVRKIDWVVAFSNLKVVYQYEATLPSNIPPLTGTLTLTANELTAHLSLAMVTDPETVDLNFDFLDQMKPESLTVEGAANVMIANFKHLLENQIVAIMSNTLLHGVIILKSLPRCEPFIPGIIPYNEKKPTNEDTEEVVPDQNTNENEEEEEEEKEPEEEEVSSETLMLRNKKKNETNLKTYKRKNKKVTS